MPNLTSPKKHKKDAIYLNLKIKSFLLTQKTPIPQGGLAFDWKRWN